jgi:RNA polymerase sigma-70 factor (ECF subfamily)
MSDAIGVVERAMWRAPLNDSPGLEDVFSRFVDPVYRFFYSHVGNREDAEDLTSEVFLKAARHLESGRAEASVAKWLFTVARTVLADHWRRHYRGSAVVAWDDDRVSAASDPVPVPGTSESNTRLVEDLLAALPPRYRAVLELRFLRGYSIQETAAELGVTPENAKVIQHRALAKAAELTEARL